MRVLLGHNFYRSSAPSGEDTVYLNEVSLLRNDGVEVSTFECRNDDIDESTLAKRVGLAIDGAWSNRTYRELSARLRKAKPDVAHFHNTFPLISPSAYAACRDNGVPVIQTLHNYRLFCANGLLLRAGEPCEDCLGRFPVPAIQHRCYRGALLPTLASSWIVTRNRLAGTYGRLVDRYIALTEFARDKLVAGGLPRERIDIKPNFLPVAAKGSGSGNTGDYAVFVGRLAEEKGVHTLVEAWRGVGDFPLILVGDGPLRAEVEAEVRRRGLPITFTGQIGKSEVLDVVAEARFQVAPSEWYEGFPMVILEAFSCGVPVIASRIGGLPEIVRDGQSGMTFECGNIGDLQAKIGSLLNAPELARRLGDGARAQFEREYTAEQNAVLLLGIYERAIRDFAARQGEPYGANRHPRLQG